MVHRVPVAIFVLCLTAVGLATGCGHSAGSVENGSKPLDAELVEAFKTEGIRWLLEERELYRDRAAPLALADRKVLEAYFPSSVLERARVLVVPGFENPEFFSIFRERGEPYPFDIRRAAAMALVDTVLVNGDVWNSAARQRVLFHELVHMVQFEVLGVEGYMEGYVDNWSQNGRRYRGIPHEDLAFELAARFWRAKGATFSVEAQVRSRFSVENPD